MGGGRRGETGFHPVDDCIPVLAEMLVFIILTHAPNEDEALKVLDDMAMVMRKRLKQGYAD